MINQVSPLVLNETRSPGKFVHLTSMLLFSVFCIFCLSCKNCSLSFPHVSIVLPCAVSILRCGKDVGCLFLSTCMFVLYDLVNRKVILKNIKGDGKFPDRRCRIGLEYSCVFNCSKWIFKLRSSSNYEADQQ